MVIVIIATIMALSLALTATTAKRTNNIYLYEQSILLSKSATEYALLQIAQNNPCTYIGNSFLAEDIYTVDIDVRYIYDNVAICTANSDTNRSYAVITTPEQNGSVLIDVAISVIDENITSEPIRYFRRSIQKL